jgi:hypothetical protein
METMMIWANLLHLSYNFWRDRVVPEDADTRAHLTAQPYLRCDQNLWNDVTTRMSEIGMNMLVIDVGDAVQFSSHPEIAVEGAWTIAQLKDELSRLRDLGLEPIPKLNFSTAHDVWLKEYSRMVSTSVYYDVCRDLIAETAELFDAPRFFHLGMDEETAAHQAQYAYAVMRQHELWWHDLFILADAVEAAGARPWIWSDYIWHHQEEFLQKMPQKILQSNWYYGNRFSDFPAGDLQQTYVNSYNILDQHQYDQIPTGSNWNNDINFGETVKYCMENISADKLQGFLMTPWARTQEAVRTNHMAALEQVNEAKKKYESQLG